MAPLRAILLLLAALLAAAGGAGGTEVLSKSRLERCERDSDAGGRLSCAQKLVLNLAVPAGSSGGKASLVTKVVDVANGTEATRRVRDAPVITISKSAVSAVYPLTYLMDVVYKPEEHVVETRKCEPYAGSDVVGECESETTFLTLIYFVVDKIVKGKRNTAHRLRFPGDRSHVWGIGEWSLGFSIRVQVKKGSSVSEVVVGPENKTVISSDNFLKANLVGDCARFTSIPKFEDVYLVTPQKVAGYGQPQDLGDEHIKWMLLERVRFGPECNQIGVGYKAFQNQPSFCSSPVCSCLNEQLWNFWENAGAHSFSVGVAEALSSNLLLELSADDIEYSYQRSPGKIMGIDIVTFEALSQVGTAKVTTKNIGKLEASYRLTFNCLSGINKLEEQYYVMKPGEVITRSFDLHSSSDEAEKYQCAGILKASDFTEVDRVECQFSTTATVFNNGTQIGSTNDRKEEGGIWGLLEAIKTFRFNFWDFVTNFLTGKSCSWTKCSSLFDVSCHFQYICIGWVVMIGLVAAMLPIGAVVLHQKGFFDPVYDWWEDLLGLEPHHHAHPRHRKGHRRHRHSHHHHGDHHQHRHHQRHKISEPSHHHVLHRHGGELPEAVAEGHRRHGNGPAPLGVQHSGGAAAGNKHRHGKVVAAAAMHYSGRPSWWLREMEDAVEFRQWRRDEVGHGERGVYCHDRRHSRF